jgi:hypothetical protein
LKSLKILFLYQNYRITDDGISDLINLTYLDLMDNQNISDGGIYRLKNLKRIKLTGVRFITTRIMKMLTKSIGIKVVDMDRYENNLGDVDDFRININDYFDYYNHNDINYIDYDPRRYPYNEYYKENDKF